MTDVTSTRSLPSNQATAGRTICVVTGAPATGKTFLARKVLACVPLRSQVKTVRFAGTQIRQAADVSPARRNLGSQV